MWLMPIAELPTPKEAPKRIQIINCEHHAINKQKKKISQGEVRRGTLWN
jgi:hypothetical protein